MYICFSAAMTEFFRKLDLASSSVFECRKDTSNVVIGVWKVCVLFQLSGDVYEIYHSIKKDYKRGTASNTIHKTAEVLGAWAGTINGAKLGASLASKLTDSDLLALLGAFVFGSVGSTFGAFLGVNVAQQCIVRRDEEK
ncbi:hypothetical protein PENTCL1PPCAC_806 [Pristionchus entomophagus]|uniref:Uncharacterized protein n=1 Tax=Pristionchus entomophagus TaxID=358040 RepID=A0AAV5S6Y4_9BILA|nr:hypothetical protein PENTCL1PPCAC_806 [Pristionchus entomophagus]